MITGLLILTLFCALQAVRSTRLLDGVLWLAAVSAGSAAMLYAVGAWEVAVIELSVGTGLVTVLMVFAITMVGDDEKTSSSHPILPVFTLLAMLVLVALTQPQLSPVAVTDDFSVSEVLWQQRELDMAVQIALIFTGVLGLLGLSSVAQRKSRTQTQPEVTSKAEVTS